MRLHPAVSKDEAHKWLVNHAIDVYGVQRGPELDAAIAPLAESLAALSAVRLPDDAEPAFP